MSSVVVVYDPKHPTQTFYVTEIDNIDFIYYLMYNAYPDFDTINPTFSVKIFWYIVDSDDNMVIMWKILTPNLK